MHIINQLTLAVTLAFVAVSAITARAQHVHPTEVISGPAGKFYETWRVMPKRDMSCCDKKDCYVTAFKRERGEWYALIRETQTWVRIPASTLEHNASDPEESPDGNNHVCALPNGHIYCAVLGSGQ